MESMTTVTVWSTKASQMLAAAVVMSRQSCAVMVKITTATG